MKFLPLVWRNLLRRKVRTIFTLRVGLHRVRALQLPDGGAERRSRWASTSAGVDRLMLMHKVSLIQLLPISYPQKIQRDAGRHACVGTATWFGGTYQDKANQFAVDGRRRRSYSCSSTRRCAGAATIR